MPKVNITDCPNLKSNPKALDKSSQCLQKDRRKATMPMANRDTYKYELRRGNKVVYVGITNDLERRETEHRNDGMDFTSISKIGNITTRDAAEAWEADRIATYKDNHYGERPEYNQNDSNLSLL